MASKHGLSEEEKAAVLAAAEKRGETAEQLSVEDFEAIAADIGVVVKFVRAVARWFGQLLG